MKKGWMIVAIALILIGLAVCFAASVMLGFDFKKLNAQPLEPNTYAVSESFDRISVRADTEKITFLPAEDGKCRVVCTETRKLTHEVEVQDNTLTVRTVDKRTWFNLLGLNLGTPTVEVYLPETAYAKLAIETDTGDVAIPGDFTFGSLRINGDTADVRCNASAPDGMEINLSTGDIDLAEIKTGDLSLTVSTGTINVDSTVCKGDVSIHVSTGRVKLDGLTCANLRTEGSTGDITLKDTFAAGKITIERSTGDVRFENADAVEIDVKTSTGDVTGTLRSEKIFFAESDTGKVSVPKSVTGGKCEITTDTGKIEIDVPQ